MNQPIPDDPAAGPQGPYTHRASVVIPCRNAASYIRRTLDSAVTSVLVHAAHGPDPASAFRIVTVDDGSSDGTSDRIADFAATSPVGITILRNPENRGVSASRNAGAAQGRPQYLLFLDDDDEFLPDHVGSCVHGLDSSPEAGFVRTGVELADPVHPSWYAAIRNTLVINLCVRIECHRFIGGFSPDPNLRTLQVEDALYSSLLFDTFQNRMTDHVTVRYHRRPGNAFDRQYARFSQPPEANITALTPEEERVYPLVFGRHERAAFLNRHRTDVLKRCFQPA
ncbi:glycosyl transferase family 2 [Azospirillum brasilense]|uniref:Glycosyl transferase family 2 n=1 Tax=Azospirillum brasilense TaxID=192 RepID=A0A560AU47_AZOBR|nr:glycosyltransferase family A protein [Azospirillum brasilense]TWA63888.1 glycosyl transferase family 2 [Azospirillum brasilense]